MILASQSPRRYELLKLIAEDFSVIPAVGEEVVADGLPPAEVVQRLAKQKADEIRALYAGAPKEPIIAADTVVAIDGKILGKPKDAFDAADMLALLSGRVHSVYTGVCVIDGERECVFAEETKVEFYELSTEEIRAYIATGEPMDKAGAYGIQDKGALIVKRIDGDYYNVMGLPVGRLSRVLRGIE